MYSRSPILSYLRPRYRGKRDNKETEKGLENGSALYAFDHRNGSARHSKEREDRM